MKKCFIAIVLFLGLCQIGSAQYLLNVKELNRYTSAAKDSSPNCFVVYDKGDTVRGKVFTKKTNAISGKTRWFIDGSEVDNSNVLVYQDEYAYVYCYPYTKENFGLGLLYGTEFRRLIKGKISLFASQTKEPAGFGNTNIHTMFFLSRDPSRIDRLSIVTTKQLEEMVKDYPPAVEKLKQEFKKINDKENNDYRAIIAVLNVYNGKN
jgi:hypothetical protein